MCAGIVHWGGCAGVQCGVHASRVVESSYEARGAGTQVAALSCKAEDEMRTHSLIGFVVVLAAGACASSQGEQVRDARMEQAEAQADLREEAAENTAATREDSVAQQADNARANVEATGSPSEGADKELIDVSEKRAEYQTQAKARLQKIAIRIDEAQQKLSALGNRAPTALKGELTTTTQQYKSLERDVMGLDRTLPDNWESTTSSLDQRFSTLDERVSDLAENIENV